MTDAQSTTHVSTTYRALAAACILHAATVFTLWATMFLADLDFMSGKLWLVVAWLWFIWPVALFFHRGRTVRRFVVPVLIGAALLVPCLPVFFTFTAWYIYGFAP